jgi:hypothetical protein
MMALIANPKSVAFDIPDLAGLHPCLDAKARSRYAAMSHRMVYDRMMHIAAEMHSNVTGLRPSRLLARSSKRDDMVGHIRMGVMV